MERFNNIVAPLVEEIDALNDELADNERIIKDMGDMLNEAYKRIDAIAVDTAVAEKPPVLDETMTFESFEDFSDFINGKLQEQMSDPEVPAEPLQPVVPIADTLDSILARGLVALDGGAPLSVDDLQKVMGIKMAWINQ